MRIKPLDDRVLVQVAVRAEKTQSGIIIPDTVGDNTKNKLAKVISYGPDCDDMAVDMTVLVTEFDGDKVEMDGVEYKIICRTDILAIVED